MEFPENLPIFSGLFFLFGVFMLNGGINILKRKKYFSASRNPSSPSWRSFLITGKKAELDGIAFTVSGILIIAVSIIFFAKGF